MSVDELRHRDESLPQLNRIAPANVRSADTLTVDEGPDSSPQVPDLKDLGIISSGDLQMLPGYGSIGKHHIT